jgi:hypothetical protein
MSQWVRYERLYFRLDPSPLCPLLGVAAPVDIHTGEGEIQADQLEAVARFLAIPADRRPDLYAPLYADYREVHGWTGAGPHIGGPEEVWALVRWDTVLVPRQGPTGHRFVFVEGNPAWEVEHGVELLFRDEQLVHAGRAEGAFRGRFWESLGRERAGGPAPAARPAAEPGRSATGGRTMTEAEWLACAQPTDLMKWERITATERKVRLFAVACCRRVPALTSHASLAAVIDTVERFADRLATEEELRAANLRADGIADSAGKTATDCESTEGLSENTVRWQAAHCAAWAASWASLPKELRTKIDRLPMPAADAVGLALAGSHYDLDRVEKGATEERAAQADLFRDIFGNPFRPVGFSTSWRTDTAVSLARQMYDSRDFSAMPILVDALQEAGCDSDHVRSHCRREGPHVRGCWPVDLVLAKE